MNLKYTPRNSFFINPIHGPLSQENGNIKNMYSPVDGYRCRCTATAVAAASRRERSQCSMATAAAGPFLFHTAAAAVAGPMSFHTLTQPS